MDKPTTSDEELIARFLGGDRPALGELAARHERALLGLAKGVLGGREELARDAVQETWVRVIRFGHTFRAGAKFRTWLYRVLINQCRSMRPPRERTGYLEENAEGAERAEERGAERDGARSPVLRVGASLEARARMDGLRAAVERLGEEKRDVLLLCYHAGMTHEVAAEVLEIPLGTLKSRLNAALGELRGRLAMEAVG